ncbi:MAG: CoA transferase, partial [Novosphingobium sp.]
SIERPGAHPVPPLNLVGDYSGGGLMLAFGMTAAILAVRSGAPGRVVDCAMTEGASALMAGTWTLMGQGQWTEKRGTNLLDGGAPFYDAYRTSDDRYVTIGAIEPKFFARLIELLGLNADPDFHDQNDKSKWPAMKAVLTAKFASRPLQHWCDLLQNEEVCFAPVVSMSEALSYPHNWARSSFVTVDGVPQPAPVPRYSGTPASKPAMWRENSDLENLLSDCGFGAEDIQELRNEGAFGEPLNAQEL